MPQLDSTWFASQIFWLFICFAVLYIFLSRIILPPLQGILSTRKGKIDGDIFAAQDLKLKAEEAKTTYENILIKSRESAQNLINEAEIAAKARTEEAIKALEAQISVQASNASSSLAIQKEKIINELLPATSEFAAMIAEKLTNHAPSKAQIEKASHNTKHSGSQG